MGALFESVDESDMRLTVGTRGDRIALIVSAVLTEGEETTREAKSAKRR